MCCKEFLKRAVPFFLTFSIGLLIAGIFFKLTTTPEPIPVVVEDVYEINSQSDYYDFKHTECWKEKQLRMELERAVPPPAPPAPPAPLTQPNFDYPPNPPETLILPEEIRNPDKK